MDSVYSAPVLQDLSFDLSLVRDYATKISHQVEIDPVGSPMLVRLQLELMDAIAAAEAACQSDSVCEDCLARRSHILWLCNQCDYYVRKLAEKTAGASAASNYSPSVPTTAQNGHRLQQVRSVVATMILLKIINHIRSFRSKPTPPMLAWREILPGIQLWLKKFG